MYKIVGKRCVDYVNRQDKQVTGVTLFCTFADDDNITGLGTKDFYVSARSSAYDFALSLDLGNEVEFYFDSYGHVVDIRPSKK